MRVLRCEVQPQSLAEQSLLVWSRVACLACGSAAACIEPESLSNRLNDRGLTRAVVADQERQRAGELQTMIGQFCDRRHGERPDWFWRVPVCESTRFSSRVGLIRSQLMLQATGVWVHLQAAAYSAGVR
jgi:hypothetical protein